MPKFLGDIRPWMGIQSVSGLGVSEKEKTACHWNAKQGWKHCRGGFGMRFQINGKPVFVIFWNLLIARGMSRFLTDMKWQMDIELVTG
ncbi:MAG: hypothetical protein A2040_06665 [Rhodocyclales bacterium GWA2_65_19]|nr:MAG: hypothetical protein A2040_06665 [Rhodocyclales bacterium GWA2_65_19]